MPSSVHATGIWVFSAKARSSSHASAWRTPWPARMTGRFAFGDLRGGELELAGVAVHVRAEAGQPGDDLVLGRVLGPRLLLEGVLGDVDVDGAGPPGPGDVERLGDDARQVVGVADQVVVLGHRQRDAVDVDLLERVLADQRAGHVAGDRDHRHRVQEGGADPGHEVGRARSRGPHAHADPAGDPRVAVGGVGAALLVADEDVAELGVVAEDVVERQDHAARVAEEDVDALAEEGLAQDVGADARALEVATVMEHPLAGTLDRRRLRRSRRPGRGYAVRPWWSRARSSPTWRSGRLALCDRHRSGPFRRHGTVRTNRKTLASRRGSLRYSVVQALRALVPPRSSVPPGAGNKAEKAIKPRKRAKQVEEGYVEEAGRLDGHVDATTIVRDDDGDASTILPIETTQAGLPVTLHRPQPGRRVAQSTRRTRIAQPVRITSASSANVR